MTLRPSRPIKGHKTKRLKFDYGKSEGGKRLYLSHCPED